MDAATIVETFDILEERTMRFIVIAVFLWIDFFFFHASIKKEEVYPQEYRFQPSIPKQEIISLESLGFMERTQNILFIGNSGVGKHT